MQQIDGINFEKFNTKRSRNDVGVSEKYKLVIVDDEKHIREGLVLCFWRPESVGFGVSGVFEACAEDAISFISLALCGCRINRYSNASRTRPGTGKILYRENRLKIKILGFKPDIKILVLRGALVNTACRIIY